MLGVTWFLPLQNAVIFNTPLGISATDPVIIPVPLFSSPVGICWNLQLLEGHALSSVGIYAMSGAGVRQVGDATELVYVPAVQLVQDPPSGPIKPLDPLLHVQSLRTSLPDGDDDWDGQLEHVLDAVAPEIVEYLPPTQRAQEAGPEEILYVPAVQLVQDPPLAPLNPLLHVQSLRASLPDGDDDWEGQLRQVPDVVAARLVEYLPAAQNVQDELLLVLNVPAGHS